MLRFRGDCAYDPEGRADWTGLSMWHRSTDEGSVTGAPLLLGAGVVVAVAIAVVAGLLAYGHGNKPQPSAADKVRSAYLAYSAALVQEVADLSIEPVRPYLT